MASRSAPTLVDVETPIVFDIKDFPHQVFKKYPQIAKVDDSIGAFLRVPDDILYV